MGIYLRGKDTLIGMIGMGGQPVSLAYFIDQDHWRKGYATEAAMGAINHGVTTFGLTELVADAFVDNPASHSILKRLGFHATGQEMAKSAARLDAAPVILYRWRESDQKAAQ